MDPVVISVTTFGGCLLGSLIPVVHSELLVLSMAAVAPGWLLPGIVGLAALGQMTGKVVLYLGGRGSLRRAAPKPGSRTARIIHRLESRRDVGGWVLFASASAGLPPLYAMSVASGMMGLGLSRFIVIGLIGRVIRFGLLVQVPELVACMLR